MFRKLVCIGKISRSVYSVYNLKNGKQFIKTNYFYIQLKEREAIIRKHPELYNLIKLPVIGRYKFPL